MNGCPRQDPAYRLAHHLFFVEIAVSLYQGRRLFFLLSSVAMLYIEGSTSRRFCSAECCLFHLSSVALLCVEGPISRRFCSAECSLFHLSSVVLLYIDGSAFWSVLRACILSWYSRCSQELVMRGNGDQVDLVRRTLVGGLGDYVYSDSFYFVQQSNKIAAKRREH